MADIYEELWSKKNNMSQGQVRSSFFIKEQPPSLTVPKKVHLCLLMKGQCREKV